MTSPWLSLRSPVARENLVILQVKLYLTIFPLWLFLQVDAAIEDYLFAHPLRSVTSAAFSVSSGPSTIPVTVNTHSVIFSLCWGSEKLWKWKQTDQRDCVSCTRGGRAEILLQEEWWIWLVGYLTSGCGRPTQRALASFPAGYKPKQLHELYKLTEACTNKSMLVCKMCLSRDLRNVTLMVSNGEYVITCFDTGFVHNYVSPPPPLAGHRLTNGCVKKVCPDLLSGFWHTFDACNTLPVQIWTVCEQGDGGFDNWLFEGKLISCSAQCWVSSACHLLLTDVPLLSHNASFPWGFAKLYYNEAESCCYLSLNLKSLSHYSMSILAQFMKQRMLYKGNSCYLSLDFLLQLLVHSNLLAAELAILCNMCMRYTT